MTEKLVVLQTLPLGFLMLVQFAAVAADNSGRLKIAVGKSVTIASAEQADGYWVRVPVVCRFSTGELLCRIHTTADAHYAAYTRKLHSAYTISRDGGRTWEQFRECGLFGRVLQAFPDGTVLELSYPTAPVTKGKPYEYWVTSTWWSEGGNVRTVRGNVPVRSPFDLRYGKPGDPTGPYFEGDVVPLTKNHLLATAYGRVKKKGKRLDRCFVFESKDRGQSWRLLSILPPGRGERAWEPSMVRLANGELLVIMAPLLKQCRSADSGQTWGPLEQTTDVKRFRTAKGNKYWVHNQIYLMSNGVLVHSCGERIIGGNTCVVLRFSADGIGREWTDRTIVFDRDKAGSYLTWGYSDMIEVAPNTLLVVHDCFFREKDDQGKPLNMGHIRGVYVTVETN